MVCFQFWTFRRISRRRVAGITQFVAIPAYGTVEPFTSLWRGKYFVTQYELHMVELTECHMGYMYPVYLPAIPGVQVGKENRAGANLEPLFGFVQIDQVFKFTLFPPWYWMPSHIVGCDIECRINNTPNSAHCIISKDQTHEKWYCFAVCF